jgi:protein O-GlcNAc transferase
MVVEATLAAAFDRHRTGRLWEAEVLCRRVLQVQPDHSGALHLLGLVVSRAGQFGEAAKFIGRAIEINPDVAEYWINLGTVLDPLGRLDEAIFAYRKGLALCPESAIAHNNLGNALAAKGQYEEAINVLNAALALQPDDPDALYNLGNILDQMGDRPRAIECLRHSISLRPNWAPAYNNLGLALCAAGKMEEGIAAYRHAITLCPKDAGIHENLGKAYHARGEMDCAIECFDSALTLQPKFVGALNSLGNALKDSGQVARAVEHYERALEINPAHGGIDSNRVYTLSMHPQFDGPAILRELRIWQKRHIEPLKLGSPTHFNDRDTERRLRVGLVSADFCDHVIGRNILPLVWDRDREKLEIFCYSGVSRPDGLHARFRALADGWHDIRRMDDAEAAKIIGADQIDILVDLSLHSRGNRLGIFARKPAPIQVTFAGYPGSTGLTAMDWRLTDPYLDPPDGVCDGDYSERSFRLPNSFWCYDPEAMGWDETTRESSVAKVHPLPALRNGFITFGCQNNHCKVNERVLDLWGKVLRAVKNSRMVVMAPLGEARKQTVSVMGIDAERIDFVTYQPRRDYLTEFNRIDLGLDTFPYNGHTASLDSMWMGVPLITRVGSTVVGRAGWSQLSNLGLTGLAAHSDEEFVQIAAEWAGDPERLARLRESLRPRMLASALTDGPKFARDIEAAFRSMWCEWCGVPLVKTI